MQFPVELPAVTVEDDWGSEDDRDSQCEWPKWKKDAKSRIPQGFSQFHRTQVKEVSVDKFSLKYLIFRYEPKRRRTELLLHFPN